MDNMKAKALDALLKKSKGGLAQIGEAVSEGIPMNSGARLNPAQFSEWVANNLPKSINGANVAEFLNASKPAVSMAGNLAKGANILGLGVLGGQVLSHISAPIIAKAMYGNPNIDKNPLKGTTMTKKNGEYTYAPTTPLPVAKPKSKPVVANNGGLPPVPQEAPFGTYTDLLKQNGIYLTPAQMNEYGGSPMSQVGTNPAGIRGVAPTGDATVPSAQAQAISKLLADRVGFSGYKQPEMQDTPVADKRLGEIQDFLSRYTPDSYGQLVDQDTRQKMRLNAFASAFRNPAIANIPTELTKQAEILKYLQSGYDTDMNLAQGALKLQEAKESGRVTGLPTGMFEDMKDAMANIVKPQITANSQLEVAKQYGMNQQQVAQLNNILKKYAIDTVAGTAKDKNASAEEIAQIMANSKFGVAGINGMYNGINDPSSQQLIQLLQSLGLDMGGGMNPNDLPSNTRFGNAEELDR